MQMSVSWIIIASGDGLLPFKRSIISRTDADLLLQQQSTWIFFIETQTS